jgi:hypothetical protein
MTVITLISASFQENDSIERPVSPPEGTESMFLKYIYSLG